MANFRESIDALKEAGLADSEILEIMSKSVDGQMLTKNLQKNKKSGHELTDTPSTRKKNHVFQGQKNILNLSGKTPPDII